MKSFLINAFLAALVAVATGCGTSYAWRRSVPKGMRTVSVPTFRNESDLAEIGALSTRQVLREFQREGTFAIRPAGEAALEIQGIVKGVGSSALGYSRRSGMRLNSHDISVQAVVSVIDKRRGRVLIADRSYTAHATMTSGEDMTTAKRDASGAIADDLARQIVDDVLNLKW